MIAILLDSNIYDRLAEDVAISDHLNALIHLGHVRIIACRTVVEALTKSPFQGLPDFFPVEYAGNTVGNVNMTVDDSIGSGDFFTVHLGRSNKIGDAYIADAASWHTDWLVSEDGRLRRRAEFTNSRTEPMSYNVFCTRLAQHNRQRSQ